MLKLLIGLNYKEFQVLVWKFKMISEKFIKGPNECKIETYGRPLNPRKTFDTRFWLKI